MANLVKLASKARSMGSKCESVNQAPEKPTAPNQIDLFWMFCFLGLGLFMVVLICFALYFTRRTETTWWIILHSHPQSQYVAPKYIGAWLEDCRDLVETDKSLITGCTLADNGHFGIWVDSGCTVSWERNSLAGNMLGEKGGRGSLDGDVSTYSVGDPCSVWCEEKLALYKCTLSLYFYFFDFQCSRHQWSLLICLVNNERQVCRVWEHEWK